MKTTKLITATLLATLVLSACTNEDEVQNNTLPEGAVHITSNIERVQTRAPQLDGDGKGNFAKGDAWGMYAYTDAAVPGENREYKYQETVLYWKDLSDTSPVTFSAHYPRITEDILDPTAYMYTPREWDKTDDLLHATATASKGGTVALTFKHLMHRLVVNLTAGEGVSSADLSSAIINSTAKNNASTMVASVEVNLLTGAVNYDRVAGGVNLSNGGKGNADWKVAPQDLTAGEEWLKITVGYFTPNQEEWYYNVPADLNPTEPGNQTRLESGKQLTLNLTLKKNQQTGQNEVELTGSDISGWGDGGTITDDVVIGGSTPTSITSAAALQDAVNNALEAGVATTITLGADFVADRTVTFPKWENGGNAPVITIDGDGHTIKATMQYEGAIYSVFQVRAGNHLTLKNITLDGDNQETANALISVLGGSLTLDGGATLKDLKNYSEAALSCGIILSPYNDTPSVLNMKTGSSISNIEGLAIVANNNKFCSVLFNGGSLYGNGLADVRLALSNPNDPNRGPLVVNTWPLGSDEKMKLFLTGVDADGNRVADAGNGGFALDVTHFHLVKAEDNSQNDITGDAELLKDENGVIQVRQKTAR